MLAKESTTVSRRILVVDDNRDAADTLAMVLRLDGHDVRIAYDGRTASALACECMPDVALLDIGLPDVSGYELAAQLRAAGGAALCLIALTGWGQDDDRRRAAAAGFDHHLVKPVDVERVEALIAEACAARDARRYDGAAGIPGIARFDPTLSDERGAVRPRVG